MELNKTYIIIGLAGLVVVVGVIVGITVWICRRKKVQWEVDEEKETLLGRDSLTQQYPRGGAKAATLNTRSDDEVLLAQMYIRSSFVNFKHPEVFPAEHRPDKNFFIVESGKDRSLMTMVPLGKNSPLNNELSRSSVFKAFKAIDHPFIWKTTEADYHKEKNVIVLFRPLAPRGSIKDMMYGKNKKQMKPPSPQPPKRHTLGVPQKKQKPKEDVIVIGKPLVEEKIAKWGRQVLEGIQYFRVHKFPFYNLHCGNVLLDEQGNAYLSDYEAQLVGLQMVYPYRDIVDFYTQKGCDADVILFGSFLFEISVGCTMDSPILHDFDIPADCPKPVKKLLQTIFPKEAPSEPVTIKQLINDPFFSSVVLYTEWKTHAIPMDGRAKGVLDSFKPVFGDKPIPLTNSNSGSSTTSTLTKSVSNTSLSTVASGTSESNNNNAQKKKKRSKKTSTMTSQAGAPAPVAPPPPPPGAPPPPPPVSPPTSSNRKGLLSSIENFDNKKLKKSKTMDKSKPKFK